VKGSLDRCLILGKSKTATYDVAGFVDSDYSGDLDHMHSISRYIFTLCAGSISQEASMQSIATLSIIEAKYIVATEGVKEAVWLRGLISELGISQGLTIVFWDSQSAIHLTKNDVYHSKTKHISIKHHYIRDTIATGEISVKKVHGLENPADMLIKPLLIAKFQHCLDLVGIQSS